MDEVEKFRGEKIRLDFFGTPCEICKQDPCPYGHSFGPKTHSSDRCEICYETDCFHN